MEQLKYPYNYHKAYLIAYILLLDDIIVPTQAKRQSQQNGPPSAAVQLKLSKGSADCHWEGGSLFKISVKTEQSYQNPVWRHSLFLLGGEKGRKGIFKMQ